MISAESIRKLLDDHSKQNIRKIRICTRNTRNVSFFDPKHSKSIEFLLKIFENHVILLQIIRNYRSSVQNNE